MTEDEMASVPPRGVDASGAVVLKETSTPALRNGTGEKTRTKTPDEMSEEELAEAMRSVLVQHGHVYLEETAPIETARAMKRAGVSIPNAFSGPSRRPSKAMVPPQAEMVAQALVIPPDDGRYRVTGGYMALAHLWLSTGCTAVMLGQRLALTAAHCVASCSSGRCQVVFPSQIASWKRGPDQFAAIGGQDKYRIRFPSAYNSDDDDTVWDFAVIEFFDGEFGDSIGWAGWHIVTDSRLGQQAEYRVRGYPRDKDPYPTLYEARGGLPLTSYAITAYDVNFIRYTDIDTHESQSGGALSRWYRDLGDERVVGIHAGSVNNPGTCILWGLICWGQAMYNYAQRFTNTMYEFARAANYWPTGPVTLLE